MLCDSCARSLADCAEAHNISSGDLAVLLVLKENVGYAESIDRIIEQWRGHALPLCDPLAIS